MNKKIISILICIVLFSTVAVPTIGIEISIDANKTLKQTNNFKPNSGCLEGVKPTLIADYQVIIEQPERKTVTYNYDLIDLVQQLDEEIYLGYLENLTDFGPRVTGEPACDDAGDYIYNQFVSMGLDSEYHFWDDGGLSGNNIIGTLEGNDPMSDEIYIICAHYDSVPDSPGADDDGSGTVAVLVAADLLRNAEFEHDIRFVCFSGEEQGLIGSYYYASETAQNGDNIMAVLNLDMIAYTETPNDGKQLDVFDDEDQSIWLTDYIDAIATEYHDLFDLNVIHAGWSWGSDHYYFWEFGFSAIFGHEYHFNPHWHEPTDTIENCDISYAVRITKLMIVSLAELSGFITYNAPYIPDIPSGPPGGKINVEYTYTTQTTDPQGDQIVYIFDWGDGNITMHGPYSSGETCEASHTWTKTNTYNIKVKARDSDYYESDWSDPLMVNMPRNRAMNSFILKFLERFPAIEQLLLWLMK
jgi:hypothetical protein